LRPAPVCQLRLWDARAPSGRAPRFQPFACGFNLLLDNLEQTRNINQSQQRCGATGALVQTGMTDMLAALFSLFFLLSFWIAGSLAAQELYYNRDNIMRALSGRGGVRRV